jgi:hypothetical protein
MKIELKISKVDDKDTYGSGVFVELRGEPALVDAVQKAIQNFVSSSDNLKIY